MDACFLAYIIQAVINNFLPLLFLHLESVYGITLGEITFLIAFNFAIQLLLDLVSALLVEKLGTRTAMVLAHAAAAAGLILLCILPEVCARPFTGLLISVCIYAVGGGLMEVLVSPIVEACDTPNKEMAMSLLHSFYCWGAVGVVLISTLFFRLAGIGAWKIMALLWALLPLYNLVRFLKVPLHPLLPEGESGLNLGQLLGRPLFWLLFAMMLCAGASEQAISQWVSAFAESGLHVAKTTGDLAGPMLFAVMMGLSRTIYGRRGSGMNLLRYMSFSGILCLGAYLLISLSPSALLSLAGCAAAGFAVGIFWPGTFSLAASRLKEGGTRMFALLALAGDIGCLAGPALVGLTASRSAGSLKTGFLYAVVFPVLMLAGIRRLSAGTAQKQ